VLTIDFDRLSVAPGMWVLDVGCGRGRHSFEALKRGCNVASLDLDDGSLREVAATTAAMRAAGEIEGPGAAPGPQARRAKPAGELPVRGDALKLPFAANSFDRVVASEVLEHLEDDHSAMAEVARVLKPGGLAAVSVPRWWPERICWMLARSYHDNDGGHVRIYKARELVVKLGRTGLSATGSHHAHALHVPYWWMRCVFSASDRAPLPELYHRLLVWDITVRPRSLRTIERVLDPVMGKSLVVYVEKSHERAMATVS
jgi:SAM-dependent methyltransferase